MKRFLKFDHFVRSLTFNQYIIVQAKNTRIRVGRELTQNVGVAHILTEPIEKNLATHSPTKLGFTRQIPLNFPHNLILSPHIKFKGFYHFLLLNHDAWLLVDLKLHVIIYS